MKVYKVVRVKNINGISKWVSGLLTPIEKLSCEYEIGKITIPKLNNSMLFAFLDLEDAKNFAANNCLNLILKCETQFYIRNIIAQQVDYSDCNNIKDFWKEQLKSRQDFQSVDKLKIAKRGDSPIVNFELYKTPVCCPWLKPIEIVSQG